MFRRRLICFFFCQLSADKWPTKIGSHWSEFFALMLQRAFDWQLSRVLKRCLKRFFTADRKSWFALRHLWGFFGQFMPTGLVCEMSKMICLLNLFLRVFEDYNLERKFWWFCAATSSFDNELITDSHRRAHFISFISASSPIRIAPNHEISLWNWKLTTWLLIISPRLFLDAPEKK